MSLKDLDFIEVYRRTPVWDLEERLARVSHTKSSRSGERAGLSALRHAGRRPPQRYCRVR